jgi:ATP-dependent Clp protease protease subunit
VEHLDWKQTLAGRLFEQRVVLLHGPLDDASVARASAELMTLDAEGDQPVSLRIDCDEGSLGLALTLMDVIELMGVPVRALCLGQVGGAAIGVVAVCSHRASMPSTRFMLREPTTQMEVHVRNAAQWAGLRTDERRRFCARVAEAVRRPPQSIEEDLTRGLLMGAAEAATYGLIDEVCRPDAEIRRLPGPAIGFRPQR